MQSTRHLALITQHIYSAKVRAQARDRTGDLLITSQMHCHCATWAGSLAILERK